MSTTTHSGTSTSSLHETGVEGTAGAYTMDKTGNTYDGSTRTDDANSGDYTLSGTTGTSSTAIESNTHGVYAATFTEILAEDVGTLTAEGNAQSGQYVLSQTGTQSANFVQNGTDADGTHHVTEGSAGSFDSTTTADDSSGATSVVETSNTGYSVTQTDTGASSFTMTENGTETATATETGDTVTGDYTHIENGTDVYTLGETGTAGGAFSDSVIGTDGYASTETGNHAMQTYAGTTTGGGTWTRTASGGTLSGGSGTNGYTLAESGDSAAGHFQPKVRPETGTDRYGLVQSFDDVSNANGGSTPGNVTFHANGLPWRDPLFVTSPAPTRDAILKTLQKLYPDGDLQMDMFGKITLGKNAKPAKDSAHPQAATIITDLINSKFDVRIQGVVGDPMWSIESTVRFPVTIPEKELDGVDFSKLTDKQVEIASTANKYTADQIKAIKELRANGKAGPGTGATIYVPSPNSSLQYGAYSYSRGFANCTS